MFELTVTKSSTSTPAAAAIRVTDIRRKGNAEIESQTMGVICIRDVFLPEDDNNKDKVERWNNRRRGNRRRKEQQRSGDEDPLILFEYSM